MHVGKHNPFTFKCWMDGRLKGVTTGVYGPALRLKTHPETWTAVGTIAIAWQAVAVVSGDAEYQPGDTKALQWTFVHPDEPNYTLIWRQKYREIIGPTMNGSPSIDWSLKSYDDGSEIASLSGTAGWQFVTGNVPPSFGPTFGATTWSSTDLVKWQSCRFTIHAAVWADCPDYKPYVTRDP